MGIETIFVALPKEHKDKEFTYKNFVEDYDLDDIVSEMRIPWMNDHWSIHDAVLRVTGSRMKNGGVQITPGDIEKLNELADIYIKRHDEQGLVHDFEYHNLPKYFEILRRSYMEVSENGLLWYYCSRVDASDKDIDNDYDEFFS